MTTSIPASANRSVTTKIIQRDPQGRFQQYGNYLVDTIGTTTVQHAGQDLNFLIHGYTGGKVWREAC